MRATARHHGRGKDRRGSAPWERGSAAQGDCPESLGMLKKSRAKRNVLAAVMHLRCWMAESGQNTSLGGKFSKIPSAKAFH